MKTIPALLFALTFLSPAQAGETIVYSSEGTHTIGTPDGSPAGQNGNWSRSKTVITREPLKTKTPSPAPSVQPAPKSGPTIEIEVTQARDNDSPRWQIPYGGDRSADNYSSPSRSGAVNSRTGEYYAPSGPGYTGTRDGTYYAPAGPGGMINTRTGQFVPLH